MVKHNNEDYKPDMPDGPMTHVFCRNCDKLTSIVNNEVTCYKCGYYNVHDYIWLDIPHNVKKQWFNGYVKYLHTVLTPDGIINTIGFQPFEVYAENNGKALEYGMKQFIKPDNFLKITGIKVWAPPHTVERTPHLTPSVENVTLA